MLVDYLKYGLKAGIVAGIALGLFMVFVGNPLVGAAELFEEGHGAEAAGADGGTAVSAAVTNTVSIAGAVAMAILIGVVFGVAYYFLEPAIPGSPDTKSYLLAAAGFITLSGAPWLALPPQPPGVEQALPTDVRIAWYVVLIAAGAVACGAAGYAYNRVRSRSKGLAVLAALVPLAALPIVALAVPANPVGGPLPDELAVAFRGVVAFGQAFMWLVLASTHVWVRRHEHTDQRPAGSEEGDWDVTPAD